MKFTKLARTVSLLVVGIGLAVRGNAQSFLTNGLVAYYPFNGNVTDASGNGNTGSNVNVVFVPNRFAQANTAASFASGNAFVECPGLSGIPYFPVTYSVWFKLDSFPLFSELSPDWGGSGVMTLLGRERAYYPDSGALCLLNFRSLGVSNEICYYTGADPAQSSRTPATNRWTHLVFTLSSSNVGTFYFDGVLVRSEAYTLAQSAVLPFRIGASADPLAYRFGWRGALDDVRVYNRALSSNEVAQLYDFEAFSSCSPHPATATATLVNGFIVGATITDPACGYTNTPTVLIQGGGGTGATATATVSNSQVTAINITSAGFGYTSVPQIIIGSPPFVPTVSIAVSKVKVTQHVVLGRNYVLEASADLVTWTATGPQFTAASETVVNEFDVDLTGRFFRIRQVP